MDEAIAIESLFTDRLEIRPWAKCLPSVLLEYFGRNREFHRETDPLMEDQFYTLEHWEQKVQSSHRDWQSGRFYRFAFFLKSGSSSIVGTANINEVIRGCFWAGYLGYGLDHEHEGQGLMSEGLSEVIRFGFEEVGLHRLMANHLINNTRSEAVLKRLGFTREGIARDYLKIAGRWQDHVLNSLLAKDFRDLAARKNPNDS